MPLQNRVTPFGEIVAAPARGRFTGNRGIIHDPATKTLLKRRWTAKAWIVCALEWKGVRREVMGGRSWTELFFLDEATALAAGHRPCFYCRRRAAKRFAAAWAAGNGLDAVKAPEIDAVLHAERLAGPRRLEEPVADLPDGAMVAAGETAFLVVGGRTFSWSHQGYRAAGDRRAVDRLLTPPSTIRALRAGYPPIFDPTISTA